MLVLVLVLGLGLGLEPDPQSELEPELPLDVGAEASTSPTSAVGAAGDDGPPHEMATTEQRRSDLIAVTIV